MLVLTRKIREGIFIAEGEITIGGEEILIRIINIEGDRVKVGIEAPAKYKIAREELIVDRRDK
jgi:carbon storage regulator